MRKLPVLKQCFLFVCISFISNEGFVRTLEAVNKSDTTATHWSEEESGNVILWWRVWTSMFSKYKHPLKSVLFSRQQSKNFSSVIPHCCLSELQLILNTSLWRGCAQKNPCHLFSGIPLQGWVIPKEIHSYEMWYRAPWQRHLMKLGFLSHCLCPDLLYLRLLLQWEMPYYFN